jgi:hypothetical protein
MRGVWRLLFLVGVIRATFADAAFVDVSADLEITSWGNSAYDNPPMFRSTLWKVRCVVGTNSWLISAAEAGGAAYTWHYTGSNLVKVMPRGGSGKAARRTMEFSGDLDSASDGAFISPAVRMAWLAYCSGPFLSQGEKQIPLPSVHKWLLPSDYISREGRGSLQNEVVRFEDDLGLPISIDVVTRDRQPVLQYRTLQGPVASPASTNVGGWLFPMEFRAVQYGRIRKATNNWHTDLMAHGRITSVKVGTAPQIEDRTR